WLIIMKDITKQFYLIFGFVIIQLLCFSTLPIVKAEGNIPNFYYQNLDINRTYEYNITKFDSKFTWLDLNWNPRGDAITNPGGKIVVNFTGFYDDDSLAFGASCFNNPIPYINITFVENIAGMLVTNTTFYNVSNSEAGLSLAIGYNLFHSGFLIQINNLNNLKTLATDQVSKTGFLPGDFTFKEYDYMVEFIFKQDNKYQNSTMIYDKITGVLVYSKVQNIFGPDLEIQLSDYELNFQQTNQGVPSFPILVLGAITATTLITVVLTLIKKVRLK
ncbi:MAG: hypothetical protein ACFFDF_05580, partial [Candidatus Odinarchaeota archaeon]